MNEWDAVRQAIKDVPAMGSLAIEAQMGELLEMVDKVDAGTDVGQKIDAALVLVRVELNRAMAKHGLISSTHEGWAVIREEIDELWDAVKADDTTSAFEESVQVAASAVRFLVDLAAPARLELMLDREEARLNEEGQ